MSNFDFIRDEWPEVFDSCARAESYLVSDPRAACVYARRAAELLVNHLYNLLGLEYPYEATFAAMVDHPEFKAAIGIAINKKLTVIRKAGNRAVHHQALVPPQASQHVLSELFHLVVWAAHRYSTRPDQVPTARQFDPRQAVQIAPVPREIVVKQFEKFKAQDAARARELEKKDELLARNESEINQLREQIKQAQDAKTTTDDHDYSEAETRSYLIDQLLYEAGWTLSEARDREYKVIGMPNNQGTGYVDYVLWGKNGLPLGIVEAKRTTRSSADGQQQAKLYADALEKQTSQRPVIFYTNGYEHWVWEDTVGYPPRKVQGFFTVEELELMIQRRRTRRALSDEQVNNDIAGRPYQVRAIKAVGDAFDRRQREALLVMATGSGKTRTTIALVEQLMKANWVKRVLFLADRTALVKQAGDAFKKHLPSATTVNLLSEKKNDGRVYVSTYPTMLNLIQEVDGETRLFGPGYFDLIVIDEAHRSVYAKYGFIFEYFDGLLLGLTATPKDEVDHNTYRLFHLEDGVPTDAYGLEEAVKEGYLVPPRGVSVDTKFLRQGIRYDDLNQEEKEAWDLLDWGGEEPPAEVGSAEINRFLFNEDTVDKVLATLMEHGYKVDGNDRIAKTIIFAQNRRHAEFIQRRFDHNWPELAGFFARVITHGVDYAQSLIDDFANPDKTPHIAISVDMLDTGIDVPEVSNLVFFKAVHSKTKFWQMIGRGTRLRPDLFGPGRDKEDFLVFDFCGNLEHFREDLPGTGGSVQKSLTQRIVETRLELVRSLDTLDDPGPEERELRKSAAGLLHAFVTGMNPDNVLVRPHRGAVERFAEAKAWRKIGPEEKTTVLELTGLPSAAIEKDVDAKRFDLLMLCGQLAHVEDDTATLERVRVTAQEITANLLGKLTIPTVREQVELLEMVAGDEWWVDVTLAMLELARIRFRGLVRFVEKTAHNPIYTDFEDTLGELNEVDLPGITPGLDFSRFKTKAAAYLRSQDNNIVLQRLQRNKQLTEDDLGELEQLLLDAGGEPTDLELAVTEAGSLGLFIRSLVGLDREAVSEAFSEFLRDKHYTVDQLRFISLLVDELTANGSMEPSRLFESPFTDNAPTGPDMYFSDSEINSIVDILDHLRMTAIPQSVA